MEYEAKQAIYLPATDYLNLEFHLMDTRPGIKPEAFVADLVKQWLAVETERLSLRKSGHAMRGVQWKNLFLPDGTSLRTRYRETTEFAKVIGNQIISEDGALLTPSLFANRHAKGRNAWRFVWLRFPGDDYWTRADNCRLRADNLQLKRSKTETSEV